MNEPLELSVFELCPDLAQFHSFAFKDPAPNGIFHRFNGTPLAAEWTPLPIEVAEADEELATIGDLMLLGTIPVLSARAVSVLRDLVEPAGELLPLEFSRGEFVALNVTRVVDALNTPASEVRRFDDGKVMMIRRFEFHPTVVHQQPIFKIPELLRAFVFVSDEFVRRVQASSLTGFSFRKVWSTS